MTLVGPLALVSTLLVVAGVQKVFKPAGAAAALSSFGRRVPGGVVRVGAAVEAAIAALALATGWRPAVAAVGALYLAFAGFISLRVFRGNDTAPCGCLGDSVAPPTLTHAAMNLGCAAIAFIATARAVPDILTALGQQPLVGLPMVAFIALGCWFAYLAVAVQPVVRALGARVPPDNETLGARKSS